MVIVSKLWRFFGLFFGVFADLPVHCTYEDVVGEWKVFMDLDLFEAGLDEPRTYCERGQPGQILDYSKDTVFQFEEFESDVFSFNLPNGVVSERFGEGNWTMVYDEGIIVNFKGKVFNSFFFYYRAAQEYRSVCSKMTKGWYRGAEPRDYRGWGCFYAEKSGGNAEMKRQGTFLQVQDKKWVRIPIQSVMVFDGLGGGKEFKDSMFLDKQDEVGLTYYWNSSIDEIDGDRLPESWDWSNISGKSYISSKVRQQGSCGSCYAITTVELLESRLKILTSNLFSETISTQYLLSCSFYTEGCQGGYPILLFKLIQEFGICLESSMPYTASDSNCLPSCSKSKIQISDFYYIGGYYGATSEVSIMKEVRARGPVIIDFNPGPAFASYKGGVFEEHRGQKVNGFTMRDRSVDWEKVTHSVLLVGWGVENGKKYWKCLNSWGDSWGEQGFFRILRGNDEDSIESMAEAAVPYIKN